MFFVVERGTERSGASRGNRRFLTPQMLQLGFLFTWNFMSMSRMHAVPMLGRDGTDNVIGMLLACPTALGTNGQFRRRSSGQLAGGKGLAEVLPRRSSRICSLRQTRFCRAAPNPPVTLTKLNRSLNSRHRGPPSTRSISHTPIMLSRQALLRPARVLNTQVRTYAAAAAASSKVKPPVTLFGLDGTYATALVRPRAPDPDITSN